MKFIKVEGFELLEPDFGGQYDVHVAVVATEDLAIKWVSKKTTWPRSYRPYTKIVRIFETMAEIDQLGI